MRSVAIFVFLTSALVSAQDQFECFVPNDPPPPKGKVMTEREYEQMVVYEAILPKFQNHWARFIDKLNLESELELSDSQMRKLSLVVAREPGEIQGQMTGGQLPFEFPEKEFKKWMARFEKVLQSEFEKGNQTVEKTLDGKHLSLHRHGTCAASISRATDEPVDFRLVFP